MRYSLTFVHSSDMYKIFSLSEMTVSFPERSPELENTTLARRKTRSVRNTPYMSPTATYRQPLWIAQVGQLACKYTYQRHSESELNKGSFGFTNRVTQYVYTLPARARFAKPKPPGGPSNFGLNASTGSGISYGPGQLKLIIPVGVIGAPAGDRG